MARERLARRSRPSRDKRGDRERRGEQSKRLEERIKLGQKRAAGRLKTIIKEDVPQWRPKDGPHIIDVIPYNAGALDPNWPEGDPTYCFEYWVHGDVGPSQQLFICLAEMYEKPCPICEHRQKLRDEGADDDVWKKLFPRRRNIYNIVCYDRGEEDKGVQVWDISYHYFEKFVMAISKKPGRGGRKDQTIAFADVKDGKSITFTIEPPKSKADYPSFVGHTFDDRDYRISREIQKSVHTLDEIIKIPTYEEVDQAYWGGDKQRRKAATGRASSRTEDSPEEVLQSLLEEVESLDEMDELEEFIEDHDLDVKIKKRDNEDDVKEKITTVLENEFDLALAASDSGEYTKREIQKMKRRDLVRLVENEALDIDPNEIDDTEELQEMIIDELGL